MAKQARMVSTGKCALCEGTFSKATMTRHLQACLKAKTTGASKGQGKAGKAKALHLVVEGRHLPEYWLHLHVPAATTLKELDGFLRRIWLECCGHLSSFTIGRTIYSAGPSGLDLDEEIFGDSPFPAVMEDRNMDVEMGKVLRPKMKMLHEYDFGSTTELIVKVVSEGEAALRSKGIEVLAQNDPPPRPCELCVKPAVLVCSACVYYSPAWYCKKCARKHECGTEMMLRVVNSPRVGVCGYAG